MDDADEMTLAFWFNADTKGESNKGNFLSRDDSFRLYFLNQSDRFYFSAKRWDGSNGSWRAIHTGSLLGTDHHLAVVYDYGSTSNDPVFYLDGDLMTNVEEMTTPSGNLDSDAGNDLYIGNSDGLNFTFDGWIDDVYFYKELRTQAQIQALPGGP
jgi:hypothetical protein